MADLMKDLLLYWKRGIGIMLVTYVVTYVISLISTVGNELLTALGRTMSLGGLLAIVMLWVVNPIVSGWVATIVVKKID